MLVAEAKYSLVSDHSLAMLLSSLGDEIRHVLQDTIRVITHDHV